jgi:hypothetical protein
MTSPARPTIACAAVALCLALIEADPLASLVLLAVVVAGPRARATGARRDRWRRRTAVVLGDAVVALALDSSRNAGARAHA